MVAMRKTFALGAALYINAATATAPKNSNLDRVITLLTDLRTKVNGEGTAEAATYDKFACFCKDTTAAKTTAITNGGTQRDTLQAQINEASVRRDTEDTSIASEISTIDGLEQETETLRTTRRSEALTFAKNEVDLTRAIQGLDAAIQTLKAAKTANGFVQLQTVPSSVREALALVEVMGTESQSAMRVVQALASAPSAEPDIPVPETYEFHADDVISTLEGLRTEFNTKKTDLDADEVAAQHAFDTQVQDKEGLITAAKTSLETHRTNKATEGASITSASQDLTTTSAQLLDDQAYLTELSAKCNEKATQWDTRTQTRANEITALTQAITEISSYQEAQAAAAAAPTLLQAHKKLHPTGMTFVQLSQRQRQRQLSPAPAFVQLSQYSRRKLKVRGHAAPPKLSNLDIRPQQSKVAAMLRTRATSIKSVELLKIATEVADDPFAKVKQLVQELIERLQKQAADEASHKGWCDKEVGAATQKRDMNADEIKEVNGRMEVSEARRAKLQSLIEVLDDELVDIEGDLHNGTTLRDEEKAENAQRIKDAEEGRDAVAKAIDILDKFYKSAAKGNGAEYSGLVQLQAHGNGVSAPAATAAPSASSTVDEDAPDAGFGDEYSGAQGAQEGALGLLEVVKSDFERTIAETEKAESISEQDFLELQTSLGKSEATKRTAKLDREGALNDAKAEYTVDQGDLKKYIAGVDSALQQLNALHSTCLATGMTAEERKMQREEELEALNQALCILDNHGNDAASC